MERAYLQQFCNGGFDLCLDEPKFLIALVPQNFPEDCHVVVFGVELLYAVDDGGGPFDD